MRFSGMICHHPRTNRLDFRSNQVKVTKRSKTTGPNCMKFSGMICHHPRTNRLDFGSDKVKVKATERSKTYFCHNAFSFRSIHMKPTPKCSLFKSLSSDMVTNVAFAKVCSLLSARSSCNYYPTLPCEYNNSSNSTYFLPPQGKL